MGSLLTLLLLAPSGAVADAEATAREELAQGRVLAGLEAFETAIRAADDTPTKARLRDAYLAAGWAEPRVPTNRERLRLRGQILAEKWRVHDKAADKLAGAGQRHAAIIVRRAMAERVGGEDTDAGKGQLQKVSALIERLTRATKQDKALVEDLKSGAAGMALLKEARKLLDQRRYGAALHLCKEIAIHGDGRELKDGARALRVEVEERAAGDFSPAEREAAKAVLDDARFDRLDLVVSRHFLYLGPKAFVSRLSEKDRTLMDLAYIFQSDLSAQLLTSDGERLVIYYQETFDFGGGLGGGKLIRIGNRAIRAPIAGVLHYHELGHCIFGKGWLHQGFTEGLADFAVGFTQDLLGQSAQAQRFILRCREQFVRFYLGRAQRYFLIQPYQPSAGFLFSLLPPGDAPFDWSPYRRVFHRMREAQFGAWPAREHQLMRYFGYMLATEYGLEMLDQLQRWGWPVQRDDFSRVPDESRRLLGLAREGEMMLRQGAYFEAGNRFGSVLEQRHDGWIAAWARYGQLRVAMNEQDNDRVARLRNELGIVPAYRVLGPFHALRQTRWVIFPVETHYDPKQPEVRMGNEVATWREANVSPDGFVDLAQHFGYPEHACAFALSYVYVDRPTAARIWLGSNDGHTLYVNATLAEKRPTSRRFRFDDDFSDVSLKTGWNRLLLKIHNESNPWGFLMRITQRDGTPIPGLRHATDDHESDVGAYIEPKTTTHPILRDDFRGLSKSKWRVTVGGFDTQSGNLRPKETSKFGLWYRFKVDPDKPKDGPANIVWLKSPDLARTRSLELKLVVAGGKKLPAKFGVTIDGENENDGQSGHTLVFDNAGGTLRCHWYRYDRQLYLQPGVDVKPAERYEFVIRRIGTKWWVSCNGVFLFDRADAAPLPAFGVGLLTWGKGPLIESFGLWRVAAR